MMFFTYIALKKNLENCIAVIKQEIALLESKTNH